MDFGIFKSYGVLNETGTTIHFWGFSDKMEIIRWVDDEELQKIKDSRDPFDTPACPYVKPQPENLGKLIWLSGISVCYVNFIYSVLNIINMIFCQNSSIKMSRAWLNLGILIMIIHWALRLLTTKIP